MEQKYLMDSNAVIDYLANRFPAGATAFMRMLIDSHPNLSVITKIEVLGFNALPAEASLIASFINDSVIFDLDMETVNTTISIRKTHRIKLPDAIIAATALVNNMILVTRNTADFTAIDKLKVINPFLL